MTQDLDRGTLRALKEFKAEYGIGSSEAWSYMNARKDFEQIRDDVVNNLRKKGVSHRPTITEISNLCGIVRLSVSQTLSDYVEEIIERDGLSKWNYKTPSILSASEALDDRSDPFERKIDDMDCKNWSFDYVHFITGIYGKQSEEDGLEGSFRAMYGDFFIGSHKYFKDKDGKSSSFQNFLGDNSLVLEPNELDFSKEQTDLFKEDEPPRDEEDTFQSRFLANMNLGINSLQYLENMTSEEWSFLRNEKKLYTRAKREGVLDRLEIERRLALSMIMGHKRESFEESYQTRLELEQRRLQRKRKFSQNPNIVRTDGELKKFMTSTSKEIYSIGILKRHKRWLERIVTN